MVKAFWITNFSNRNVTLSDLNISVEAGTSINLLDDRHYNFTEEQLEKSRTSGSIFLKRHLIAKRVVPPQMIPKQLITVDPNAVLPARHTSIYEIQQQKYEELDIGEELAIEDNNVAQNPFKNG